MSTAFLILAFAQPLPSTPTPSMHEPASTPAPVVNRVDVIIINQHYASPNRPDGSPVSQVRFYVSFWTIHHLPVGSFCRVPVWEHRGWCRNCPVVPCSDGWACQVDDITIVAPKVLFVASDYDFEYRNRGSSWGRRVTN